ncbi:MAG: hypothetical protein V7L30_11730 [Nostoc sp.]
MKQPQNLGIALLHCGLLEINPDFAIQTNKDEASYSIAISIILTKICQLHIFILPN